MSINLSNDALEVTITPERGADITSLVDKATGVQVFAQSPTALVTSAGAASGSSLVQWINGYPGGWQVLVPNAGPEREWAGVTQGYHGEASLAAWRICAVESDRVELETHLLTAPLHVRRVVSIKAQILSVVDQVTNQACRATSFRLCQHPAFGDKFLDGSSYLEIAAGRFLADAENPGSLAARNQEGTPKEILKPGPHPTTVSLPGPGTGESLSGAFTEFPLQTDGSTTTAATFFSPNMGLSARLSWDTKIYPHAWFWIEANATPTWPWFQRLYSVAVEPSNVLPGSGGSQAGFERGGPGTTLEGGETLTSEVTLELNPIADVGLAPVLLPEQ